jgi:hypothetical protein
VNTVEDGILSFVVQGAKLGPTGEIARRIGEQQCTKLPFESSAGVEFHLDIA